MGIFASLKGWLDGPPSSKSQAAPSPVQTVSVLVQRTNSYCVKCRTKREMLNPIETTLKNNRKAVKGICPVCGTTMFKIGGS